MRNSLVSSLHESVLDSIGEAVIALDAEGKIIVWNAAAERLYGWQATEVLGRPFSGLLQTTYEDPEETHARATAAVQRGVWHGRVRQRCKDGAEVVVESTVRSFSAPAANGYGLVAVNRDVTEQAKSALVHAQLVSSLRR